MDALQFIDFLKKENLYETAEKYHPLFQSIFKKNLEVKPHEEILIVGDVGQPQKRVPAIVLGSYLLAAKRLGLKHKFVVQSPKEKGEVAEDQILEALLNHSEGNIILWVLSGKIGSLDFLGRSFRKFVQSKKHRFISTPSLGLLKTSQTNDFMKALDVNYDKMQEDGKRIKAVMDAGNEVRVITDAGTNLHIDVTLKHAIANIGFYKGAGSGGNLPAGEVYIPPRKKGVNGVVIIDGCARITKQSLIIKHPIKLTIEDGVITQIEGKEEAKALEETLKWAEQHSKYPWGIRRIGEFGLGINPNAKVMESTLLSEKALGTAHIAIGSNYWFGGTIFAIVHLDQVFKKPRVWVDEQQITV